MSDLAVADAFEALVGNRYLPEPGIGFEPLGRAARLVLLQGLNDQIDHQRDRWLAADLKMDTLGLDPGVGQTELPHVEPANLHEGPHESILAAGPGRFPNVSVMAYATVPSAFQLDQLDSSDLTLFAESFAMAGPVPEGSETIFETVVHRRIQRLTEAVHATLRSSMGLLGATLPMQQAPRGGVGSSSFLKSSSKSGPRYLIHGSRLQYTLQRTAALN